MSDAELIKMPSAAVLRERLKGHDHFIEKTKIDEQLANREMHPLGVAMIVETSIYDYCNTGLPKMMCTLMEMNKPLIIRSLLANDPAAIAKLEEVGLLQSK